MPYVIRNEKGEIVAIHQEQVDGEGLWEQENTEEHKAFIKRNAVPFHYLSQLTLV